MIPYTSGCQKYETHLDVPRSREVISKLVETRRHHPVRRVERFFHPVPVMNVDIDVEHSGVMSRRLYRS
jgi:hypothetical protein